MLQGLTSWWAAQRLALVGVVLFVVCLVVVGGQKWWGPSDSTEIDCKKNLSLAVSADKTAQLKAGELQILGVWPPKTFINYNICVGVGGVVTEVVEKRLADEIERAQKARDDAKTSYDAAVGPARDSAWDRLQKTNATLATALAAAANQPQPVELSVFLNGKTAPDLRVKAYATSSPQILLIRLKVPTNAGESGATFWRELLSARPTGNASTAEDTVEFGQKAVTVGLSRSSATMPESISENVLTVVVYEPFALALGIASFVCLALGFCGLARHTTLLRDNPQIKHVSLLASEAKAADTDAKAKATAASEAFDKAKIDANAAETAAKVASEITKAQATENATRAPDAVKMAEAARAATITASGKASTALKAAETWEANAAKWGDPEQPVGPYSLARTQMAFWMILTLAGFVYIWLSMGLYLGLITGGILVLLGINAATGLTAVSLNDESDTTSTSKSFFEDILNDGNGPTLHRIQAVAWTCILGTIFVWNVFWNFTFVDFDTNLLLLIGVAQSMYLGFKWREAPAKKQ
jgi:hypothetical protein